MKSTNEELIQRGYVDQTVVKAFLSLPVEELVHKINSDNAAERTAAVIALRKYSNMDQITYAKLLLDRLCIEKSLYTKIELCNSLELGNEPVAELMCDYLGRIGNNQHKIVPDFVSKKKSFPLPRDIIARSLGRMDKGLIRIFMHLLDTDNREKLSELLDAVGYMIFYHEELAKEEYFLQLQKTYQRYTDDDLIVWKIAMCCSAFPLIKSKELLEYIKNSAKNHIIIMEAERSLQRIVPILSNYSAQ